MHLKLRTEVEHPAGRLKNRDFLSDSAGRVFRSPGDLNRSSTSSENTPHDHEAEVFATELARVLEEGRNAHAYDELILIAEPRFLGVVKAALSEATARIVVRVIDKELSAMSPYELERHLTVLLAA
jgi:protein required for attachment to host cells